MGHYRFYELNPSDHITAGYSVECGSDAEAMRAARTLLERAAGVEVWTSNNCVAHLSADARHLWSQLLEDWMGPRWLPSRPSGRQFRNQTYPPGRPQTGEPIPRSHSALACRRAVRGCAAQRSANCKE
jgi:hypothetical protein